MRVVITGATGAIGHALIAECIKQNTEVLAICRKTSERARHLKKEVCRLLQMESQFADECKDAFLEASAIEEKVNALFHMCYMSLEEYAAYTAQEDTAYDIFFHLAWDGTTGAARCDEAMQMKNTEYALDAVLLAKKMGCHTFVGAGSQAEYGRAEGKLTAATATNPENEYGKAKLAAGEATRALCKELSIRHIWVRILSVYGPYDTKTSMIMSAISQIKNHKIPKFTKGEQQWDYLYSGDAAKALLLAATHGKDKSIYPIGSGNVRALADYITILKNTVDPDAQIDLGAIPYAKQQVMYLCADISQLNADTGFVPETEFETGIKKILAIMESEEA